MNTHAHPVPATLRKLSDIVDEYDAKLAAIPETIKRFEQSVTDAQTGSCVGGRFVSSVFDRGSSSLHERTMKSNLLQSAWWHVYDGLNIGTIAPASDRSRYETELANPPPFTLDNIRANFGKYLTDPRSHILRGLAECFGMLDPAFKSHDKMKVGVKGLPKRIIVSSVGDYVRERFGGDLIRDVANAVRVLTGNPHVEYAEMGEFLKRSRPGHGPGVLDGLTLQRYQNGNGHLSFDPATLRLVNKALAEYYGEVLPDCPESKADIKRQPGTEVSKGLAFYPTPTAAADALVRRAELRDGDAVLEPSCGDGSILDAVRRYCDQTMVWDSEAQRNKHPQVSGLGIEVNQDRAREAEAKGYSVLCKNFLEVQPSPKFDKVLMNPPFYGKHYQKHVNHARKFLKPGGVLYAILPVTALTDHGFVEADRYGRDKWEDLPTGSFSESGTNINTGIARFFAP